jgi:hypothetical protein
MNMFRETIIDIKIFLNLEYIAQDITFSKCKIYGEIFIIVIEVTIREFSL